MKPSATFQVRLPKNLKNEAQHKAEKKLLARIKNPDIARTLKSPEDISSFVDAL